MALAHTLSQLVRSHMRILNVHHGVTLEKTCREHFPRHNFFNGDAACWRVRELYLELYV
jgi:hypothetical protein